MDSQKRLLLALGLSVALTSLFLMFNPPTPAPTAGPDAGTSAAAPSTTPAPADLGAQATQGQPPSAGAPPAARAAEVREIAHDEEDVRYRVSSRGAGLVSAELQGRKMREQRRLSMKEGYMLLLGQEVPDAPQIDMAALSPRFPPSLAVGIRGVVPLDPWLVWSLDEEASQDNRVVMVGREGPWEVRKTFEWPQSSDPSKPAGHGYEVAMTVAVTNTSAQAVQGELAVHYARAVDPQNEEKPSWLGSVGNESKATCYVRDKMHQLVPDHDPPKPEDLRGPLAFFGVDQQYFLGAVFPVDQAREGRCEIIAAPNGRVAVGLFPLTVQPGQTVTERFGVYVGPKEAEYLKAEPTPEIAAALGTAPTGFNAQLHSTVNFGIWEVICVVLLWILKRFYLVFANWGVATIFLTLTVKVALIPLSLKSMMAAENMKKLQPRMEEIRKKFQGDRERMNMEVMKLYQEAKVNPLGGCFPLLIQMPVWIALFTTLRNSYEIYREPFFGPVWTDLTYKDPTYILPVMLGVTMIITQKLQPAMMDKAQQRMMTWIMPIFFTALMLAYPAGLTLYIFTNNVLSIAQQYGLRKYIEKRGGAETKAVAKRTA
jgi:YidC/Oxa1 family membrane protein insertase